MILSSDIGIAIILDLILLLSNYFLKKIRALVSSLLVLHHLHLTWIKGLVSALCLLHHVTITSGVYPAIDIFIMVIGQGTLLLTLVML